MTPVVGFVADIANAGISVARGNYADASINLAAAVPGAGQAVMGAKMAAVGFGVYKSAKFAKGAGSSFSGASNKLATNTDEAVFWSGIGRGGDQIAAAWVSQNGGATLETTLANRNIKLPAWDANNPSVVSAWERASLDFANGASGNVRVLQGDALRTDAIFGKEFNALINNPNVNSIRSINPDTGLDVLLWSR